MSAPSPANRKTAIQIVVSVVVVASVVGLMLKSSMSEGAAYYKHVNEVMSDVGSFHGKKLQVHGFVVDGSIEQAKGTLLYRFKIESRAPQPAVITATYNGLVPDTFKGGAEVVATGSLTPDNQLAIVPDGIMAKCPSKYEADKQQKPGVAQKL